MTADSPAAARNLTLRDFRYNPAIAEGALPVIVFWLLNLVADPRIAIAGSFVTAVIVFIRNSDSGVIRFLSAVSFTIVAGSAVVGLVLDSDKAFAAQNIVSDFSTVPLGIGTIIAGRPLVGMITRELVPAVRPFLAENHRTFIWLTLIVVGINVVTGFIRWYMLGELSTNNYVVLSRVLGLPFNFVYFTLCYVWIRREIDRVIGAEPVPAAG